MHQLSVTEANYVLVIALSLPILLLLMFKHFRAYRAPNSLPLPPGPTPWPVLGNIPHLMGSKPLHVALAEYAKTYGPLISLKLGSQYLVVGSSPEAAREILKAKDRVFSGRCIPHSLPNAQSELSIGSIGWAVECTDQWKLLRSVCKKELFSNTALENHAKTVQKKLTELVSFLKDREGEAFTIKDLAFATLLNIMSNALMSRDFTSLEEINHKGSGLKREIKTFMEASIATNVSDLYPMLAKLDLQGLLRKTQGTWTRMKALYQPVITERRSKRMRNSFTHQDLLDAVLDKRFFRPPHQRVLHAGTDTTASATEWLLIELIKNPECMKKIRAEIKNESNDFQKDLYLMKLPYLEASVKEALRLHPPAAIPIPHMALETCQVMNYKVPKNAQILVNIWALGRDPSVWEEPLKFKPERFLESNFDYNGNSFEFLPFGNGMRICPAWPMASKFVPWIAASLVHFFDFSLPNGTDPAEINMEGQFGITMSMKQAPMLHFKARN